MVIARARLSRLPRPGVQMHGGLHATCLNATRPGSTNRPLSSMHFLYSDWDDLRRVNGERVRLRARFLSTTSRQCIGQTLNRGGNDSLAVVVEWAECGHMVWAPSLAGHYRWEV